VCPVYIISHGNTSSDVALPHSSLLLLSPVKLGKNHFDRIDKGMASEKNDAAMLDHLILGSAKVHVSSKDNSKPARLRFLTGVGKSTAEAVQGTDGSQLLPRWVTGSDWLQRANFKGIALRNCMSNISQLHTGRGLVNHDPATAR
jgi:hypothetical protein